MELKKGKLIRRMTTDGKPIGPWMQIKMSNCNSVYALPLGFRTETLILRKNVYDPKIIRIPISVKVFAEIVTFGRRTIAHDSTKLWSRLCKEEFDLCEIYTQNGDKAFFTIDSVLQTLNCGRNYITLLLGNKLL